MSGLANPKNRRSNSVAVTLDAKGNVAMKQQTPEDRVWSAAMKAAGAIVDYNKAKADFFKAVKAVEKAKAVAEKADTALLEATKVSNAAGKAAVAAAMKANAARAAHEKVVTAAAAKKVKAINAVCEKATKTAAAKKASAVTRNSRKAIDQTQPPSALPDENDIYNVGGYAGDIDGSLYLHPETGKPITTDEMFEKIEANDWNA